MEINPKEKTRVKIGGKFSFSKLQPEVQKAVRDRLASKDNILASNQRGILPGIKINGIQVTKDNIKDFEIEPGKVLEKKDPKPVSQVKPKVKPVEPEPKENHGVLQTAKPKPKSMTEHEIYALKKDEQIEILNKLDVTEIPHYEKERVALIVKLQ